MVFKEGELRILWPFYLCGMISGLFEIVTPFIVVYFINIGFTFFEISFLTAAFSVSILLFEVPTGILADLISRKYSVVLGLVVTGIPVALVPLTSELYYLILLWAIAGIGVTLASGATEAWVVDNIIRRNRPDLKQEFFIKNGSIIALGAVLAPSLAAFLVKYHSTKVLWPILGLGFLLCAGILALFSEEGYRPKRQNSFKVLRNSAKRSAAGLKLAFKNKVVFYLILAGIFTQLMLFGASGVQPLLVESGLHEYQLGYVYSASALISVVAPFLSRISSKHSPKHFLSAIVLLRMLLLLSVILFSNPFLIVVSIPIILSTGLGSLARPVTEAYLHRFIPKQSRATLLSIRSMAFHLALASSSLLAGILLDEFGAKVVISLGGFFGIGAYYFYQKIEE